MKYHPLPHTDLTVSQLCFGCWGVVSDAHWGAREERESLGAMEAALESGITFFDTAPMYGDGASESLLGRFLAERQARDRAVIATKVRPSRMRPEEVVLECHESLERLQTDYIDLYQTHWTSRDVPIEDTWGAMLRLQEQGKVRHLGTCNMGTGDLDAISKMQKPVTNQLPFNLLWRMIEAEIMPRCQRDGIGILAYSPLMHGILADRYKTANDVPDGRARTRHFGAHRPQTRHGERGCEDETFATVDRIRAIARNVPCSLPQLALAWTIRQPAVVSVIAGARNADQVRNNLSYLACPLTAEIMAQLNDATAELNRALGTNVDMWQGSANSRYR